MLDYHVHLENGPYTLNWVEEFLRVAEKQGVVEMGIVEHLYLFREAQHLLYNEYVADVQKQHLEEYLELMARAKQRGWPIKVGIEVDYFADQGQAVKDLLDPLPLDFVMGSVHYLNGWAFDLDQEHWEDQDIDTVYQAYYQQLAQAATCGLFDILGHPGNIAYFGHYPAEANLSQYEDTFLDNIASTEICIEINAGGLQRPAKALFPRPPLIEKMVARGHQFTLASDAHWPKDVGHAYPQLKEQLKDWGITQIASFNQRKKIPYKL